MRSRVIARLVGSFLQVFAAILLIPLVVGVYYNEPIEILFGYSVAAIASVFLGYIINYFGASEEPTTKEAVSSTVAGWLLAIIFGAVPFLVFLSPVDAVFESAAGITTTGISMFLEPELLPDSLLFWRSFLQWIGGLGVLTFFIAVIRETGGASRRLFSAEQHKTDPGTVRPSLTKTIIALWKVYILITVLITAAYYALGTSFRDALLHTFSVVSTGGFSTMSESIAGFGSTQIEIATIFFMLIGGSNFVLLYAALKGKPKTYLKNTEFKTYIKIFLVLSIILTLDLFRRGFSTDRALVEGFFQSAAVLTSTGYTTISVMSFSIAIQALLIGVMFVGGSLGSTSGGFKTFRLITLFRLLKTRLRSYSLPESAINEVKIDDEIIDNETLRTISVLFFAWVMVIFAGTVLTLITEDMTITSALSGVVSSASNMGPVYMEHFDMVQMNPITKIVWSLVMLAGRLEMLPLLAIFNSNILTSTKHDN